MRKLVLGQVVAAVVLGVSAMAAPAAVVVQDDFQRTSASGWGSAVLGGAWTPASGAASVYTVSGGRGVLANPTAGSNLAIYLNASSVLNVDARLLASGDQTAGSNAFVYFEARRAATTAYRLKVRFAANGQAFIRASRVVSNAETDLGTEVLVPGAGAAAGVRLRVQVEGTSPTTLRMKAWDAAAGTEPASWLYTATDTAGPQVAGNVGIRSYLSGSVTNAPRSARIDDLTVDDMAPVQPPGDPVLIGAGDIASVGPGAAQTAAIINANPAAVVYTLGDNAYPNGSASDFATYYEPTWGPFRSRTRFPVAGNHEYNTSGASGHYGYFGAAARGPNGYWSDDTLSPSWHVIVLNSNCSIVSCAAGSAQLNWLRADLAANTKPCTVALFHHPRFSSGEHGNDLTVAAFWDELYAAGADLVLNGHDHNYERFVPQTPAGVASPRGIQQFVVGTGGVGNRTLGTRKANSAVFDISSLGVLKVTLHANSYDYAFLKANGTNNDAGTMSCHSDPVFSTDLTDRTDAEGAAVALDADAGDNDGDALTYSATGLPPGVTISASTGLISGTLSATSAGVRTVTVSVSDGTGTDTDAFVWTVTATNVTPIVDSATIAPAGPTTAQTLTATVTGHDPDGDALTTAYQWTRNGTDIAGATSSTLNLATAGNGDKGDLIRVRVTVSDGQATSAPLTSNGITVANSAPGFSTDLTDREDAEGDAPSLDADAADADADTLTYSASGLPGGSSIDPSTGVISGTLTTPGVASVTVSVTDGTATDTDTFTWTVAPGAVNTAPVVDSVTIVPASPTTGQTLTATVTAHDDEGDALTTSYQWTLGGADIAGATGSTLDLAAAGHGDRGDVLRVRVEVSDGDLASGPTTSAPVTVANSAPAFSTDLGNRADAEGEAVDLDVGATDADAADTLTYSASGLPDGATIDAGTGAIGGTLAAGSAGVHAVTVTVSDGDLEDTDTFTWTVTVSGVNTAPVVDSVTIGPASPTTAQTLTATVTAHDDEGDALTTSYQWTLGGADIAGATGSTLNLATAGHGDRGDVLRVRVEVSDGDLASSPTTSDPVTVANSAPAFSTDLTDRSDVVGDPVDLDADATDADGDPVTYSATGLPAGATIDGPTGSIGGTLTTAGVESVVLTASDGDADDADTFTWTVAAANTAPVVDSVTIVPASPTTGQTLTATVTSHDDEGDALTTSYQWTLGGADIAGATGSTLDLAAAGHGDRGDVLRVRVEVSDGDLASGPTTSAPVTVANSAPAFTTDLGNRTDAEDAVVGLDVDATDADAADTLTYSASGLPDGAAIDPATGVIGGTLSATSSGVHAVTVTVSDGTATDSDTFTWTVTEPNTAPVVDAVTVTPASPTTGQTVTATVTSHDAEGGTLTTSYQWSRNGTDLVGATSSTLNLATAGNGDRGDLIRVRVTVSDGSLASPPSTSSPVTVANSAPTMSTNLADRSDAVGTAANLDANATDPDGDTLTFSATGLPAGAVINAATGVISGTLTTAGTSSVTIRVSDGTAFAAVNDTLTWTVTPAAPTVYANDTFTRTSSNTWGSANTGGAYTLSGTAADFDVAGGLGTIVLPTAGANRAATLAAVSALDVDLTFRAAADKVAAGGQQYVYGLARRVSSTAEYRFKVRLAANGAVFVQATAVVANTETSIGSEVQVAGLTRTPGQFLRVRGQVQGTSPATLRMRAWADGAGEPTTWQYTATNTAATLQAPGGVGVRGYMSSSITNAPVTFTFDDLRATSIGP